MTGTMYGIGVGPGDPELMTIRAIKRLKSCQVIAIPHTEKAQCTAYGIAVLAAPEIAEKECLYLSMPMTKDPKLLEQSHQRAAELVMESLDQGNDVGFITLGDVSIYSTGIYIVERVKKAGYQTALECGIPSFCAAAARLNLPLVNGAEELHIIPASYQVAGALGLEGVKVLMKAGRQMKQVKAEIAARGCSAVMVENCGMPGERVFQSLEDIPDDPGYYSLLIVK